MTQRNVIVALGANLPGNSTSPLDTLRQALNQLKGNDFQAGATSRVFNSKAFPPGAGPDFVNAVAMFLSDLSPNRILERLHDAEARLGRVRRERWGARVIDLDLISVDGLVLPDRGTQSMWMDLPPAEQSRRTPDRLILPHPRMQDRGFVLIPLCDVAPEWRHPVLGLSARQMRDALDPAQREQITPLTERGTG